jgi:biotin carboxyl carrier protein
MHPCMFPEDYNEDCMGARKTDNCSVAAEYPPCLRSPDTMHLNQLLKRHESDKDPTAYPSHTIISMPALSPTMTSGNIGTWQKNPGDTLAPGDVLVEIETDKAQMDFEFQEEGVLAKLLKGSGEKDVAVGNVSLRTG